MNSKDSILDLQNIDCNCNDCVFMNRDMGKFEQSKQFHNSMQLSEFERNKAQMAENIKDLELKIQKLIDEKDFSKVKDMQFSVKDLKRQLSKIKYLFNKDYLMLNFGKCTKLNKDVSFIPNTCQIDTQNCFEHRRK